MTDLDAILQAMLPQYYVCADNEQPPSLQIRTQKGCATVFLSGNTHFELVSDVIPHEALYRVRDQFSGAEQVEKGPTLFIELVDELICLLYSVCGKDNLQGYKPAARAVAVSIKKPVAYYVSSFDESRILRTETMEISKSRFFCSIINVASLDEVESFLEYIHTDSHTSDATHSIAAWVIDTGDDGFDEDGEKGAGKQLLFMLQKTKVKNFCVAVHRWYGGIKLGPKRFQIINGNASRAIALLLYAREFSK